MLLELHLDPQVGLKLKSWILDLQVFLKLGDDRIQDLETWNMDPRVWDRDDHWKEYTFKNFYVLDSLQGTRLDGW